jgi:hypothetical protein
MTSASDITINTSSTIPSSATIARISPKRRRQQANCFRVSPVIFGDSVQKSTERLSSYLI